MGKNWKVALAGIALIAASCGSDGSDPVAAAETTTTTTAVVVEESIAPEVAGETLESEVEERLDGLGEACGDDDLPMLDQMVVTAASGLRVRQLPLEGDVIDVLPTGTVVDTIAEANSCGVLEDGVWFEIGSPLLATNGWVSADFLGPADAPVDVGDVPVITDDDRPEAFGVPCDNTQLPVAEQWIVIADGGLNARAFPVDGPIIEVLPTGTVVDTVGDENSCGVVDDGVWFEIGTPLLATGGWVSADFLEPNAE